MSKFHIENRVVDYLTNVQTHIEIAVTQHITPPTGDEKELVVSTILIEPSRVSVENTNEIREFRRPILEY
jgi:hypothetical protein